MITGMEELFFTDKEELRAYQMRQMALSDWTSAVNYARREGFKEGLQQAMQKRIQEVKEDIARAAMKERISVKDISEITGLSPDAIKKL